jgi:serine/threonine protein kinase/tetratricopeptide (TPR) repeat protein
VLGPAPAELDPDATVLRPTPRAVDPDATVLTPTPRPADPDATVLKPTPRAADPDATVLTQSAPALRPATGAARGGGDSGPLMVGDTFGRYTIVKMLGIGGMGAVYQAWDKELEVVVALKVIRPEVLQDPEAAEELERRFKRELLLARQVTHRNVVRIHDLGEIDGIKYITMSYVDGRDLSTLLKEVGQLSIPMTLRILKSIVSGLVAAHAAGVVHRDLKPANIMIANDGEALIMDFGIARSTGGPADGALPPARAAAPAGVTATGKYTDATVLGAVVGTVEYMAPEQARGEAVDQRADIYATGLILYDVLTGRRRAERPGSALDRLRERMEGPLPPVKSLAPDVPDALAEIVTRATEPDPQNRYQTTTDFAEALDRLDEHGVPRPIKRSLSLPRVAAIVAGVAVIAAGAIWYLTPEKIGTGNPVAIVIADFENRTNDPAFNRTLEPTLRRALEGAGFITAYDRNGLRGVVTGRQATLPEKLDETAARELAVKQGLGVVLSGSIDKSGNNYTVAMKATRAVSGEIVSDLKGRASGQDQVIGAATKLVASVRKALGDATKEKDQMFAMTSLSASNIEVVRYYAAAQEAASNNKFDDARENLLKAVQLDPNFGVGYLALAGVSQNLRQPAEAEKYVNQAMSHLDNMTERERYTTRGMLYRLTADFKKCKEEHSLLIEKFKADIIGRNQLALCASNLREWKLARETMQGVVDILPERATFRDNLALYSNYDSEFTKGELEAREVIKRAPKDAYAWYALGFAQMGQGLIAPAIESFTNMAPLPPIGPAVAPLALASIAAYEGRYAEAVKLFEQGAAADLVAKSPERAATKFADLAQTQLLRGQKAAAAAAADKALANSTSAKIRFLAARIFIDAGQLKKATPLMTGLAAEVQPGPQSYGKLLEAQIATASKDPRPAIKLATDAIALLDTWIAHYELGRAYLAAGMFAQADSEFDQCINKRHGEGLSLFVDEEPTFGYFPMAYFYQGRVREGMKLPGAADSYRAYLTIREKAGEDPLLADLRRRAGTAK